MLETLLTLILILTALQLFLTWKNGTAKNQSEDLEKQTLKILESLEKQEMKNNQTINSFQLQNQSLYQENFAKLDKKLAENQSENTLNWTKILQNLKEIETKNQTEQKLQAQVLQNLLQKQLAQIQAEVAQKVETSILNLNKLTQAELTKLNGVNKENFKLLSETNQKKLDEINLQVQAKLDKNLSESLKSFEQITHNLGKIESTAKGMIESTKSVDKLNQIFARTSSKAFGSFAEVQLENLLAENLSPNSYAKQFKIPETTQIIDFVIFMGDKKIGIDSKFPLTAFQDFIDAEMSDKPAKKRILLSAVKKMASDLSEKYYQKGYLDQILIYFPSNTIYEELVQDSNLNQHFNTLRITPCSPTNLLLLLMVINGYQYKLKVGQNVEKIVSGLKKIDSDVTAFRTEFLKLGEKLNQAQKNYSKANQSLTGVQNNVSNLVGDSPRLE